jgi:hypothetical protein
MEDETPSGAGAAAARTAMVPLPVFMVQLPPATMIVPPGLKTPSTQEFPQEMKVRDTRRARHNQAWAANTRELLDTTPRDGGGTFRRIADLGARSIRPCLEGVKQDKSLREWSIRSRGDFDGRARKISVGDCGCMQ